MKIIWHGHSCFSIDCEDGLIVLDPYKDNSVPGLKPLSLCADLVLCSHQHDDHNALEVIQQRLALKRFHVKKMNSFHDDVQGQKRGNNTIHIISSENMTIVHLGDLGHELEDVNEIKNCDVLMIPVGGYYTIDAKAAHRIIKKINPRIVIPMHYSSNTFGYDVLDHLECFLKDCQTIQYCSSNSIEINQSTPSQTIVLKYQE